MNPRIAGGTNRKAAVQTKINASRFEIAIIEDFMVPTVNLHFDLVQCGFGQMAQFFSFQQFFARSGAVSPRLADVFPSCSAVSLWCSATLISLVFCGIIFFNVLNSGNNYAKFRAHSLIYEAALKTKTDKRFIDEKIEDDGILIQKTMSSYNGIKDLHLEIFTASDANGKLLDEYKEIIFLPGQ